MKIKAFIAALLLCAITGAATGASAQPAPTLGSTPWPQVTSAFAAGEKLTFFVSYKLGRAVQSDMMIVEMKVSNTVINNIPAYRITANAQTLPAYKFFYDLNDTYETWLDQSSLKPLRATSRLQEAKYRYNSDKIFDWENMKVHSTFRRATWKEDRQKTMSLTPGATDALGFFYNLRSVDMENFRPGDERSFDFVLDDTIRKISYRFVGRENKAITRLGTFKTLKFACKLASSDEQTFKDGSEFYLWISDDRNRIPLYIESPIKVGSIAGYLAKFEGLKYPLESKIK